MIMYANWPSFGTKQWEHLKLNIKNYCQQFDFFGIDPFSDIIHSNRKEIQVGKLLPILPSGTHKKGDFCHLLCMVVKGSLPSLYPGLE